MSGLAGLVVATAAVVWAGQWVSLHALTPEVDRRLPRRLQARLRWWTGHRTVVGAGCAAVGISGLLGGLLAG